MRNYVMEFIGTAFLVMAVGLTGNPLAIGLMLMVMIYMGGHISGAHYNPAITIGVWLRGSLPASQVGGYIAAQILGAIAAGLLCFIFKGETFAAAPAIQTTSVQAYLAEIIFTFALVSVVLAVATTKKMEGNYIYGLAIGLTVTASAYAVGGISGGAFNPAVGVGPILVNAAISGGSLGNLLLYIIGPSLGGVIAAYVYKFLNSEQE